MKKLLAVTLTCTLALFSCTNYDFDAAVDAVAKKNAEDIFGLIDPRQDWNMISSGTITITADAPLDDIVKVQILTESPFGNPEATVLNQSHATKGDVVTLVYDAPKYNEQLIAACVSSKGVYYVKVFNIGDPAVSFSSSDARTRAGSEDGYPAFISLGSSIKSFNAERAEASQGDAHHYVLIYDQKDRKGKARYYDVWQDGSWLNDRLWSAKSVTGGNWNIDNGTIWRAVTEKVDMATVKTICNTYLKKTGGTNQTNGKANNWQDIAQGNEYFSVNNNYVISNGSPVTLIPIQMNTSEGNYNSIYYYYYKPSNIPSGMSEVDYIKSLPKFKAINGYTNSNFIREKEYLLPYYGDTPSDGATAVSNAIPSGYKIGFLNRKDYKGDYSECMSGCTYGDGRLNVEVNHIFGHYFSPMDKSLKQTIAIKADGTDTQVKEGISTNGMQWDSPRIGVFSANNTTYLCFEDGADLNFCDMIVEVSQGTEVIEETMIPDVEPEATAYTMCFEDRPHQADYDLNDVVLRCTRTYEDEICLTVVATGADDKVYLHGIAGSTKLNDNEVHSILHVTRTGIDGHWFVNTIPGGTRRETESEYIKVSTSMTIPQFLKSIYIENATTGQKIQYPTTLGEPPYAIIVPEDFQYPQEFTCITDAYSTFLTWARDINYTEKWYSFEDASLTFPSLFKKW